MFYPSQLDNTYCIEMMDLYFESVEDTDLDMNECVYVLFNMGGEL